MTKSNRTYEDTYRHKGLRKQLVEQLRNKGITDSVVLNAMEALPRHYFLDSAFDEHAYEDRSFQIGCGQTISQPYTVAYQSQLLEIKPFMKVLEIGTGSGYQAAVLGQMGALVHTIERQRGLFDELKTFPLLQKMTGVKRFYGDGFEGLPTYAPFDRVIITAAAPYIPPKLIDQLKPGGMMVLPLGEGNVQQMMRIRKQSDGTQVEEVFDQFSFVPMLAGRNR